MLYLAIIKKHKHMAKKKQPEYFEDKYGIKTLKTPISENDKELLKQIQESINKQGMFIDDDEWEREMGR
jgi:hypothetical protein